MNTRFDTLASQRLTVAVAAPAVALALIAATPKPVSIDAWAVDGSHTEINFSVNHFFTPVTGSFEDFEVTLDYDRENPANSSVGVVIQTASVNTGNAKRDEHLLSPDFFDADNHPHITFRSTLVREVTPGSLIATGDLTIKGNTRQVQLPIEVLGVQDVPEDMQGMLGGVTTIASFVTETRVDRNDYGVGAGSWAATLVVGGEVDIAVAVEAHKQ